MKKLVIAAAIMAAFSVTSFAQNAPVTKTKGAAKTESAAKAEVKTTAEKPMPADGAKKKSAKKHTAKHKKAKAAKAATSN